MAKWNTHQDMENRAYSHILTTLFPEQTKTLPRIIIWAIIFLIDLIVVVVGAQYYGLLSTRFGGLLAMVVLFGGFWLQGFVFFRIYYLFRPKERSWL